MYKLLYTPLFRLSVDFTAAYEAPQSYEEGQPIISIDHVLRNGNSNSNSNGFNLSTPDSTPLEKLSILQDSFLIHFLIDQNLGLPFIYECTPYGRGQAIRDTKNGSQPASPEYKLCVYHPKLKKQGKNIEHASAFQFSGFPTFRVYHLLLFAFSLYLLNLSNHHLKLIPYRAHLREMDRLIQLIRGRLTLTHSDPNSYGWFERFLGLRHKNERFESEPDPRIVEQMFMSLLSQISQQDVNRRPSFFNFVEAKPEIVFVFDEMDKLSGNVDAEFTKNDEAGSTLEDNIRERKRSQQLHKLLSDMKRLLSSNSARFIFIGGRLYHDEWLADLANRSPLLTSIFNGHIYLPSLLTDREHRYGYLNDRISEFVSLLHVNSIHRFDLWREMRNTPAFWENPAVENPTYIQDILPYSGHKRRFSAFANHSEYMRVIDENGNRYSFQHSSVTENQKDKMTLGELETLSQLINFLTYRSQGNPKKLKEMLQDLILPASKGLNLPRYNRDNQHEVRWKETEGHHDVLVLDDHTIYRIQFIDMLYRHLMEHIESRTLNRDDKVAMSVFYLMDFLLKFHNRGFSWTNLQRVDELSHIHRAPDLRSMMGVLVDVSSERFLHRVLNGVYSFRFRSDLAREIDYLSRISKDEMAAMNFTLDESQSLKGLYQQTINTGERENTDTIAGLGELYEYDQEYEIARNYYRRAIARLDHELMVGTAKGFKSAGSTKLKEKAQLLSREYELVEGSGIDWLPLGFVQQAMEINEDVAKLITANFTWAISRLRLMLQVAHTYEQERNYERALGTYMHSYNFSQAILNAHSDKGNDTSNNKISSKNYSILYQSGMAAAWIYEKDNQDIDESIRQVEHSVRDIYFQNKILFSDRWKEMINDREHYSNDSLSVMLIASDLHNKAGDLFFYKGRQSTRGIVSLKKYRLKVERKKGREYRFGYLLQAHHHYSMSFWQIRHFLALRNRLSAFRLNILKKEKKDAQGLINAPTLHGDGPFPDMMHNALANSLTDISEAILARGSIGSLLRSMLKDASKPAIVENLDETIVKFDKQLMKRVNKFLRELPNTEFGRRQKSDSILNSKKPIRIYNPFLKKKRSRGGKLSIWLGKPNRSKDAACKGWPKTEAQFDGIRTLVFPKIVKSSRRMVAYTFFSTAAARSFVRGNYSIDGANEYLYQAEIFIDLLWTIRRIRWMLENTNKCVNKAFKQLLMDVSELKHLVGGKKEKAYRKLEKDLKNKSFDKAQCMLGLQALAALRRATNLIQISNRPSSTRFHLNHGNPSEINNMGIEEVRRFLKSFLDNLHGKEFHKNLPSLPEIEDLPKSYCQIWCLRFSVHAAI